MAQHGKLAIQENDVAFRAMINLFDYFSLRLE